MAAPTAGPARPVPVLRVVAECGRSRARAGELRLPHGTVPCPVFMPVGTRGTAKGLTAAQLAALGCRICLGNTFHLGTRPVSGTGSTGRAPGGLRMHRGCSRFLAIPSQNRDWRLRALSVPKFPFRSPRFPVPGAPPELSLLSPQGSELVRRAGGLHGFMDWPHNLLTVSLAGWHPHNSPNFWVGGGPGAPSPGLEPRF